METEIKFNPEGKEELTIGEARTPAMSIVDSETAKQYLADYVAWMEARGKKFGYIDPDFTVEEFAKCSLANAAGWHGESTLKRIMLLFDIPRELLQKRNRYLDRHSGRD